jgi:hypothetical protein
MTSDEVYRLKYLAGITDKQGNKLFPEQTGGSNISIIGSEKGKTQREQNIKPGTDEWFKLWFAKPHLTGGK